MTERITIFTGYTCNNRCRFCCEGNKRNSGDMSTDEIIEAMKLGRSHGATFIDFIGGESTIRKDIFRLVSLAKQMDFKTIKTTTNGRMYSYRPFAEKMAQSGITGAIFSIHGPDADVHDYLTRSPGSFSQAVQGIKNLLDLGITDLETNSIIVKRNYSLLPEMEEFFLSLGLLNSGFIFPDPDPAGYAYTYFDEIVPKLRDAEPYIHKAIEKAVAAKARHVVTQYVPACIMSGLEDHIGEFLYEPETEHHALDFVDPDVIASRQMVAKLKGEQCRECMYFNVCEGVWKQYGKRNGFSELVPVKGELIKSKADLRRMYFERIYGNAK